MDLSDSVRACILFYVSGLCVFHDIPVCRLFVFEIVILDGITLASSSTVIDADFTHASSWATPGSPDMVFSVQP